MTFLSDCNNPSSSSSATLASVLVSNVDMLTQILLRLPVKSLLVFKYVSKQWFTLISDPFFCNKYNKLQKSLSIRGLYTQIDGSCGVSSRLQYVPLDGSTWTTSSAPFKTLDFINDPLGITIVQSCNGLMCCRSNPRPVDDFYSTYYVCNPSTRQYRSIICESKKREKGYEQLFSVSLAYDPLKSPHYKVVCIWLVAEPTSFIFCYQIEVYSSETASWKLSGEVYTFFDGTFFYFNVDRELRMEMRMPVYDKELYMEPKNFGECQGRLYLTLSRMSRHTNFEILEMKTDYTGWSKRYAVNLQEVVLAYPGFDFYLSYQFDVLLVREVEGESPKNMVLMRVEDKVFAYDLHDMSFKEIRKVTRENQENVAYQYIETLASV
ncbi:F-box protein At5g07610-like [Papaver somniferum]|uniref:F-box protein At5g07610-like n=1 Tax=Papaver somniferum TaxID=3469 RepID=UPI000E6F5C37|nr:F-box protein At5g07610-like [Papaver somniferum]